jgi:hypothetical protein
MTETDAWNNFPTYILRTRVNGIAVEDGGGHSWNLLLRFVGVKDQLEPTDNDTFEASYNDNRRRGRVGKRL